MIQYLPGWGDWRPSIDDYHAADAIGSSQLNVFIESRRRYRAMYVTRELPRPRPTKAMILGDLVDSILLDDAGEGRYVVAPRTVRARRGKDWDRVEERAAAAGKTAILYEWRMEALVLVDAIRSGSSTLARNLLLEVPGDDQPSFRWRHEATGLILKARPDRLALAPTLRPVELKAWSPDPGPPFAIAFQRRGAHRQASLYRQAVKLATGEPVEDTAVVHLWTGGSPPKVRVPSVPQDLLRAGHRQVEEALEQLAECLETDDWAEPGEEKIEPMFLLREQRDALADYPRRLDASFTDPKGQPA